MVMKFIESFKKEIEYLTSKNWSIEETGKFWDTVVDYDDIHKYTPAHNRRFKDAFPYLRFHNGSSILDFCCRTGDAEVYLADNFSSTRFRKIVCADVSQEFLKKCATRLKNLAWHSESILISDYRFPFADNSFDIGFCFETVEHFCYPDAVITEFARVLKRKGQIVFTTPNILWEPANFLGAVFGIHHSEGPHSFLPRRRLIKAILGTNLIIQKEITTILFQCGPKVIANAIEKIEKRIPKSIMRLFALRRIFICKKI